MLHALLYAFLSSRPRAAVVGHGAWCRTNCALLSLLPPNLPVSLSPFYFSMPPYQLTYSALQSLPPLVPLTSCTYVRIPLLPPIPLHLDQFTRMLARSPLPPVSLYLFLDSDFDRTAVVGDGAGAGQPFVLLAVGRRGVATPRGALGRARVLLPGLPHQHPPHLPRAPGAPAPARAGDGGRGDAACEGCARVGVPLG
jgi:hypothetical protein